MSPVRPRRRSSSSRSLISILGTPLSPRGGMPGSWMNAPVAAEPVTTGDVIVRITGGDGAGDDAVAGAGAAAAAAGEAFSLSVARADIAGRASTAGAAGRDTTDGGAAGRS